MEAPIISQNFASYYEETSENEQEVAAPLNIQVNVNLESPPPASPSPVLPPPPIPEEVLAPVRELPDDGNNFMNCYTRTDVLELKNWAQETRGRRSKEGYVVEAPLLSQNFVAYLQEHYGEQWEVKLLQPAAEPIFECLLAYIVGYARLTSYDRYRLRSLFGTWAVGERAEKLRLLAESGGFLEIE